MRRKESEIFITSIYELDQVITELDAKELAKDQEEYQELLQRLPSEYSEYVDTFSERRSNDLPPSRSYDHKINLEEKAESLGYSPLYKMTRTKLDTVK